MTDNEDPIAPISRLMRRANDVAHEEGLIQAGFSVVPNYDPKGPHAAQVVLQIDPEFDKPEQESDPEFEAIIEGARKAEQEEKMRQAREQAQDLADKLKDPSQGLGLDD